MQSPRSFIVHRETSKSKHQPYQSRRFLSIYHKAPENLRIINKRKSSPQKISKLISLDTQTDIVDELMSYDYKGRQRKKVDNTNLDSLFNRNQSSMDELMKLREKQLEKLK